MAAGSKIEWTAVDGARGFTWNPVWGCQEVGPECGRFHPDGAGAACYAAVLASRGLHKNFTGLAERGKWTGAIAVAGDAYWQLPFRWARTRPGAGVFTASMADLWYEGVPVEVQARALDTMDRTPELYYLLLTKRPAMVRRRLAEMKRALPSNAWLGVTVGHQQTLPLVNILRQIPASIRFLSCEPLLTSLVGLDLTGIDWVITGGQSGAGALPIDPDHVREIRDLCQRHGVAFFHKQWGVPASNPTPAGRELDPSAKGGATLDGRLWREFPAR